MIFGMKDKIVTFSLISSLFIHAAGFIILKVKILEASAFDQYLEVGLTESRWEEPLVDLPGETNDEGEIFGPSDRLWLKRYSKNSLNLKNGTEALELPQSNFDTNQTVPIDKSQIKNGVKAQASDQSRAVRLWTDNNSKKDQTARFSDRRSDSIAVESLRLNKKSIQTIQPKPRIEGPAAKRKVLFQKYPDYPMWARRHGLEFEIRLKFWVLPSGEVSLVIIEDSSGYPEIDAKVVRVMKRWKFNRIESTQTQWGMILFKFRLRR
jgi:TonB family protein